MPFDFGKPINTFTSSRNFNNPPDGGYKFKIVGSAIVEKNNKPKWELSLDIAEGPYEGAFTRFPRKVWQDLSTDVGKSIAKRIIETIINDPENTGMASPSVLESNVFDESTVIGLFVGGICKTVEVKGKKYLNIDNVCAVSVALEKTPKTDSAF